jgi:hypothetical protein
MHEASLICINSAYHAPLVELPNVPRVKALLQHRNGTVLPVEETSMVSQDGARRVSHVVLHPMNWCSTSTADFAKAVLQRRAPLAGQRVTEPTLMLRFQLACVASSRQQPVFVDVTVARWIYAEMCFAKLVGDHN